LTKPGPADKRRWLAKPLLGAGGGGIVAVRPGVPTNRRVYFQEYLEGPSLSAVYVGNAGGAQLFGVTRQLVGANWLNARPFQYCGSLTIDDPPVPTFALIGEVLAPECGLRGLFGVDCIVHDGVPWPVEVNPRYTASVEVVEWQTGRS